MSSYFYLAFKINKFTNTKCTLFWFFAIKCLRFVNIVKEKVLNTPMLFYGRKYQISTVLWITHGKNTECKNCFSIYNSLKEKTEAVIKNGQYRETGNIQHD
jgi:hypothetical protein